MLIYQRVPHSGFGQTSRSPRTSLVTPWKLAQLAPRRLAKWPWHAMARHGTPWHAMNPPKETSSPPPTCPYNYSIYIHVWYIYLQSWVIFRANVGKYSSTMEQKWDMSRPIQAKHLVIVLAPDGWGPFLGYFMCIAILEVPCVDKPTKIISRSYHMISAYHISK